MTPALPCPWGRAARRRQRAIAAVTIGRLCCGETSTIVPLVKRDALDFQRARQVRAKRRQQHDRGGANHPSNRAPPHDWNPHVAERGAPRRPRVRRPDGESARWAPGFPGCDFAPPGISSSTRCTSSAVTLSIDGNELVELLVAADQLVLAQHHRLPENRVLPEDEAGQLLIFGLLQFLRRQAVWTPPARFHRRPL